MEYLNDVEIGVNPNEKGFAIDGLEDVPDGTLNIEASNKRNFKFKMQINDMSFF